MKFRTSQQFVVCILLLSGSRAFAQNAPDTSVITAPNFQQVPIGQIKVTPQGGAQQSLATALAVLGGSLSLTGSASNTLSGITGINFSNCTLGGASPNATVTCLGGSGTTYTGTAPIVVTGSVISAPSLAPAYAATITAAGTAQSGATSLTAATNVVTSAVANSGVISTISTPGTSTLNMNSQLVLNTTTVPIYYYPPSGAQVGTLAVNAGYLVNAGAEARFIATSATQLQVIP